MASNEELKAMEIKNDNVIICENCYEENEATRTTCKNCGAKLYKRGIEGKTKEPINESYNTNNNSYYDNNNKIAMILRVFAIIEIVAGFIVGGILGDTFGVGYRGYDFNWGLFVGIVVAGFMIGIFILGFAEIIQLLQDIKYKIKK